MGVVGRESEVLGFWGMRECIAHEKGTNRTVANERDRKDTGGQFSNSLGNARLGQPKSKQCKSRSGPDSDA